MARARKKEEIRKELLGQGIEMFISQGYHGTGIKEVVDRVGIPKGSFYNYFKSKEDYGSEVIREYSKEFKILLNDILEESEKNAFNAIRRFFDVLIKRYENKNCREGCLVGNLAAEISDSSELGRKTISVCIKEWKAMIIEIIRRGQAQKKIRTDIKPDRTADFLINSIEGAVLRMKIESDTGPIKQFKELFLQYISAKNK